MRDLVATALAFAALVSLASAGKKQPNLLFVIADDCTYTDLACYGGQAATPHLDRLCAEGLRMTRCFQAAPMCSPTRHNLYTGLYPVRSGAYPNHTFVKPGVKSVAHYLGEAGYRVALSGKTHIAPRKAFPFEYSAVQNNPDFAAIDRLMGECVEASQPFCVFVCSNEPHSPWNKGDSTKYPPESLQLPRYWVESPELRRQYSRYLAEVTYFDGQVGEALLLLEKHDLADETLVMVVSEQGNGFPFAKWTCYDAGLHSAMVVRWPGRVEPGSESNALVEYVDVAPTFIEAAGGHPPVGLEGESLLPVLTGNADRHKDFVYGLQTSRGIHHFEGHCGRRSIRGERFHLIRNLDSAARFANGMSQGGYFDDWRAAAAAGDRRAATLIQRFHHPPEFELFDMHNDPHQLNNLARDPAHAGVLVDLNERLAVWMQDQGDLGQSTEMAALDRMRGGKARARAAGKERHRGQGSRRERESAEP